MTGIARPARPWPQQHQDHVLRDSQAASAGSFLVEPFSPAAVAVFTPIRGDVRRCAAPRRAGYAATTASVSTVAVVTRSLRFVAVRDGTVVDHLDQLDDGTIRPGRRRGTADGVLATHMQVCALTEAEAFAYLGVYGWSDGHTMIHLDDLG